MEWWQPKTGNISYSEGLDELRARWMSVGETRALSLIHCLSAGFQQIKTRQIGMWAAVLGHIAWTKYFPTHSSLTLQVVRNRHISLDAIKNREFKSLFLPEHNFEDLQALFLRPHLFGDSFVGMEVGAEFRVVFLHDHSRGLLHRLSANATHFIRYLLSFQKVT